MAVPERALIAGTPAFYHVTYKRYRCARCGGDISSTKRASLRSHKVRDLGALKVRASRLGAQLKRGVSGLSRKTQVID